MVCEGINSLVLSDWLWNYLHYTGGINSISKQGVYITCEGINSLATDFFHQEIEISAVHLQVSNACDAVPDF